MKKINKEQLVMGIIIGLVCIVLICVMFVQFKTVEETDITAIENMKEDELRTTLSEWKTKYEETYEKYEETIATIDEYNKKIESSEEASELLDKELENSNLIVGNTDIYGEGIIVTLTDNNNQVIVAEDLLELINELRYAGAEAISINDVYFINGNAVCYHIIKQGIFDIAVMQGLVGQLTI